jgi:hypothetical protein
LVTVGSRWPGIGANAAKRRNGADDFQHADSSDPGNEIGPPVHDRQSRIERERLRPASQIARFGVGTLITDASTNRLVEALPRLRPLCSARSPRPLKM